METFIMQLLSVVLITFFLAVPYASFFEWTLHRYLMHQAPIGFRYAYEAHAQTHHRLFRSDYSYHLQPGVDQHKITMAWWNSIVIIVGGMLPFDIAAAFVWHVFGWQAALAILLTSHIVGALYYGVYEYAHWCMHLPRERRLEKWRIFRRMNGHHVLHHFSPRCNFNVVLPLADWTLGTLVTKAKRPFPQAHGPSVPNVQP